MAIYGQPDPPEIPIENINVPVGLVRGTRDPDVTETGVAKLMDKLGDNMVMLKVIDGDHWSISIGQDMSFFSEDVVDLLHQYNPVQ